MEPKRDRASILIIEDDPLNQALLLHMLHKHYQLEMASTGAEGLSIAVQCRAALILLDVGLPDIDGFEVCRRLKTAPLTANIPVIVISALSNAKDLALASVAGATDFIRKPFSPAEVLTRIRTHLPLLVAHPRQDFHRHSPELISEVSAPACSVTPSVLSAPKA